MNDNICDDEILLRYSIKVKGDKIRIFGDEFIQNNCAFCKILINGIENKLREYISKTEIESNNGIIQIKLKGFQNIGNIRSIFKECETLLSISDNFSKLDIREIEDISYLFYGCKMIEKLPDISKWYTKDVKIMKFVFDQCISLKELPDISQWDITNVSDMTGLFLFCQSLKELPDISKWKTKNVNNMCFLFFGCSSLEQLPDISKWNIENVKHLS